MMRASRGMDPGEIGQNRLLILVDDLVYKGKAWARLQPISMSSLDRLGIAGNGCQWTGYIHPINNANWQP